MVKRQLHVFPLSDIEPTFLLLSTLSLVTIPTEVFQISSLPYYLPNLTSSECLSNRVLSIGLITLGILCFSWAVLGTFQMCDVWHSLNEIWSVILSWSDSTQRLLLNQGDPVSMFASRSPSTWIISVFCTMNIIIISVTVVIASTTFYCIWTPQWIQYVDIENEMWIYASMGIEFEGDDRVTWDIRRYL